MQHWFYQYLVPLGSDSDCNIRPVPAEVGSPFAQFGSLAMCAHLQLNGLHQMDHMGLWTPWYPTFGEEMEVGTSRNRWHKSWPGIRYRFISQGYVNWQGYVNGVWGYRYIRQFVQLETTWRPYWDEELSLVEHDTVGYFEVKETWQHDEVVVTQDPIYGRCCSEENLVWSEACFPG